MLYAEIDNFEPKGNLNSKNVLDRWILAKLAEVTKNIQKELDHYDPYKPASLLIEFVQELSTWYIRRSRRRFWKSESDTDKNSAYETLYYVLRQVSILLAPFAPMFAETLYLGLKQPNDAHSVHLCDYPQAKEVDKGVIQSMAQAKAIVEEGLSLRMKAGIKVRQPLSKLLYTGEKLDQSLTEIICEEVNIKEIEYMEKQAEKVKLITAISKELASEGLARELVRKIQDMRKKADFDVADRIEISFDTKDSEVSEIILKTWHDYLIHETLARKVIATKSSETDYNEEATIEGKSIWVGLKRVK
jgi:isoleucyl-tRNA synthetase